MNAVCPAGLTPLSGADAGFVPLTDLFRAALRLAPEPVAVVTTSCEGHRHGMTATAFASVSAEPPKVLVCINRNTVSSGLIRRASQFAVNFLTTQDRDLAEKFSRTKSDAEHIFLGAGCSVMATGAPVLDCATASIDCVLDECHDGGTHHIVVGNVVAVRINGGQTLLYCAVLFGSFQVQGQS